MTSKKPTKKHKVVFSKKFDSDTTYLEAIAQIAKEHPEKQITMPASMFLEALEQFEYVTMCRVIDDMQSLVNEAIDEAAKGDKKCQCKSKKCGSVKCVGKK